MPVQTNSWMTDLGDIANDLLITQFPLPGSHDAISYGTINQNSKTQLKSIKEQLEAGVRYFDLRVRVDNSVFFGHHGSDEVRDNQYCPASPLPNGVSSSVFTDIKTFSDAHPDEIIVLHFYDATAVWNQSFNPKDKKKFVEELVGTLGLEKLASPPASGSNPPTYGQLKNQKTPIIAMVRDTGDKSWRLESPFDAAFCEKNHIWLASSWFQERFSGYDRLAGRSYEYLYELTAQDQNDYLIDERDLCRFWVSQTILDYDNTSTTDGHSANYWGAKNMNKLWMPTYKAWFHGKQWNGKLGKPVPKPNILLIDYSGCFDTLAEDFRNILTLEAVVPIYMHQATEPERYFYNTVKSNTSGWTQGVFAFNALSYQYKGTVPIYKHQSKARPDRYFYDTNRLNNSGWKEGVIAFYAFKTPTANSVPIYRHRSTEKPDRYYYDQQVAGKSGWTDGVIAFHVPPNN